MIDISMIDNDCFMKKQVFHLNTSAKTNLNQEKRHSVVTNTQQSHLKQ